MFGPPRDLVARATRRLCLGVEALKPAAPVKLVLMSSVSEYGLHEGLVHSLFAPGSSNMANVAHFMCELVTNPKTWAEWKGKLPVVTNVRRRP